MTEKKKKYVPPEFKVWFTAEKLDFVVASLNAESAIANGIELLKKRRTVRGFAELNRGLAILREQRFALPDK
jgi:hypothetical protein